MSVYAQSGYAQEGKIVEMTATQTSERESIVKEYEWAITDIQKALVELTNRLQPVLRPDTPSENVGQDAAPQMLSDARLRLRDLHETCADVRRLLDRLEV